MAATPPGTTAPFRSSRPGIIPNARKRAIAVDGAADHALANTRRARWHTSYRPLFGEPAWSALESFGIRKYNSKGTPRMQPERIRAQLLAIHEFIQADTSRPYSYGEEVWAPLKILRECIIAAENESSASEFYAKTIPPPHLFKDNSGTSQCPTAQVELLIRQLLAAVDHLPATPCA